MEAGLSRAAFWSDLADREEVSPEVALSDAATEFVHEAVAGPLDDSGSENRVGVGQHRHQGMQMQRASANVVSFQKLPLLLCSSDALVIAMFEQAGFEAELLGLQLQHRHGQATGNMMAHFCSKQAAEQVVKHFGNRRWGLHAKIQMINTALRDQHDHIPAGAMLDGGQGGLPTPGRSYSECLPPTSQTPLRPCSALLSRSTGKFTQRPNWDHEDSNPPVRLPNREFSGGLSSTASSSLMILIPTMPSRTVPEMSCENLDERNVGRLLLQSPPSVPWADANDDED